MNVIIGKRYLSNGLGAVLINVPNTKSVITAFYTKASTRFNPKGKEGIAHFMEHVLLEKTKKYPTNLALAKRLEEVGAAKSGSTYRDYVSYFITTSKKDYEVGLDVLSQIILNPLLDEKSINKERKVIEKEIARKSSRPEDMLWDLWFKIYYKNTTLEVPNLGTLKTIGNIEIKDLNEFWSKYYLSKGGTLFIAGDIDIEKVFREAENYFGHKKIEKDLKIPLFGDNDKQKQILEHKKLPQTSMLISFTLDNENYSKEKYTLSILRKILAVGWSSRIAQRLRLQEGLIYSWGSTLQRLVDSSTLLLSLQTAKNNFSEMNKVFCEEVIKLKENGVSREELEVAKGYLEGSLARRLETASNYLDWHARYLLFWPEEDETVDEWTRNMKKVSASDVHNLARKYFTDENWNLAVVGENKNEDVKIKL